MKESLRYADSVLAIKVSPIKISDSPESFKTKACTNHGLNLSSLDLVGISDNNVS